MSGGVDPQTLELARHFLEDTGGQDTLLADLLAEQIQGAVEDWFESWFERGDRPALAVLPGGKATATQDSGLSASEVKE